MKRDLNDSDLTPAVAVPARNEAARLSALLASLAAQSWIIASGRRLAVHIVLNNTDDDSQKILANAASRHPGLDLHVVDILYSAEEAHVGSARRLAMDVAARGLSPRGRGVILTTDADAQPASDWIEANLAAIKAGADAVGGRIIGNAAEEAAYGPGFLRRARDHMRYADLCDQLAALFDPVEYDPWPRHHDHTGASLAVTSEAYEAVGGLPALPFREDLAFVSRLRAGGFKLAHPLSVQVSVSARLGGRAPGGMADCLKSWILAEAAHEPHLVEDPKAVLERSLCRRAFRDNDAARAPALIEHWAADVPDAPCVVPIEEALLRLEAMIAQKVVQDVC